MENIEKNIKDFLYFAEFGENKSLNTIKSLKKDLSQLSEYLKNIEKIEDISKITPVMLRGFIIELQKNEVGKRSINRKLSSLRSFFKYLIKNNLIKNNPIEIINSPSFEAEKPDILTLEEINKLREVINIDNTNGLRDRLILELLYSSGITSTEMLGIGEQVFDLDNRTLLVSNGKTSRTVFFSQRTREYFKRYIEAKKEKYKEKYNSSILFVNGSGNRLSDRSLRRIVDRYAAKAGITREISPYSFRHTFAVHLLAKGMGLNFLQELMGHVTIESTKIYQEILHKIPFDFTNQS
ncbi:tyrosine-type recombinase/integrase [Fusobacterium varium]|jgi:integrase/recombinase XerD